MLVCELNFALSVYRRGLDIIHCTGIMVFEMESNHERFCDACLAKQLKQLNPGKSRARWKAPQIECAKILFCCSDPWTYTKIISDPGLLRFHRLLNQRILFDKFCFLLVWTLEINSSRYFVAVDPLMHC